MAPTPARLSLVILAVQDVARAARFYREAFAWTQQVDAPVYAELEAGGGLRVGLYQREGFARNATQLPLQPPTGALTATELYVFPEDVEAAQARLLALGARRLSALLPRDWGDDAAYFADLDGNVVVVARARPSRG